MKTSALILYILAQLLPPAGHSQVTVSSINRNANDQWLSYSFPWIRSANKTAADKINHRLQAAVLDNEQPLTDTNIVFEATRYNNSDSNPQSGYSMIGYEVATNTKAVFSLTMWLESTGAYSENYSQYYNFNGHTGETLTTEDLFTTEGIKTLEKILVAGRKKIINKWINEMKVNMDYNSDSAWINETFAACNEEATADNFLLKTTSIVFDKEHCFPHVARAFDADLRMEFSYKKVEKYLNDNGKRLLLPKRK